MAEDRTFRRGMTCQVTAFEVLDAPSDPVLPPRRWMAVATAHVYDPEVIVPALTPAETVIAGETMRVISSRGFAEFEVNAMTVAIQGLLYTLAPMGLSTQDGFQPSR